MTRIETQHRQNLSSLQSMIGPEQRNEFIKKMFKGNESSYNALIQDLEIIDSWGDALKRVEVECDRQKLYLHDQKVISFTDILYRRYYPEE